MSTTSSMWATVEETPLGSRLVRRFFWPSVQVEYTTTERVREAVPESSSDFDSVQRRANRLHVIRGAGFEHSWRGDHDVPLTPPWLSLVSAALDGETGRVVGVGRLTHEAVGLPRAHDLGAIDGRNAFGFPEAGHPGGLWMPANALYIGSIRTGAIAPLDARWRFMAADIHGATGAICTIDFLGEGAGSVAKYGLDGERQLLTVLGELSGSEAIRFSPDGRWLLISGSKQTRLVEVETGRVLALEIGNSCWWPLDGSVLLTIEHSNGAVTPRMFSLVTDEYVHDFPRVELDVPLLPTFPYVWDPLVSPDGDEVLGRTPAGVTAEHQRAHGTGDRLARFSLQSGIGRLEGSAFFDEESELVRDVSSYRWTRRSANRPTELGPLFTGALRPALTTHALLSPGRTAQDAQRMLVLLLNRAIELTQNSEPMAQLMPEILAAVQAIPSTSESWAERREWLTGLLEPLGNMITSGEIGGADAVAWSRFRTAIFAVESGIADLIEPVGAVWADLLQGESDVAERVVDAFQKLSKRRPQGSGEELLALVQSWIDAPEVVSEGEVSVEDFCATVDQLLHLVPEPGLLDLVQDVANRTALMEWASGGSNVLLGETPWGRVRAGMQRLRAARGWPDAAE